MSIQQFIDLLECDTVRIVIVENKQFLIIGKNRNTKEDEGVWYKDGQRIDFDYVVETTVASGTTDEELEASAIKYKQLCKISWEDYFAKQISGII